MSTWAVRLTDVVREHRAGRTVVAALDGVSLDLRRGDALAVVGPSGAGKSTLLHLVAGLDRPTSGRVEVFDQDLTSASSRELTRFRSHRVGIVFQDDYLLPGLTALENVAMPVARWRSRRAVMLKARSLLAAVGLEDRADFPPARLSGGERQRVGIARALIGEAELLVADEPTGNLDAEATADLLALLDSLRESRGLTLVVATHDPVVADHLPRSMTLHRGRVVPC